MPDLHVRLTSFLAGHLPWRVLRLDARLHRLVEGSLEDDPTEALEKCWNLLDGDPEAACDYIAHSYSSSLRFDVSRIYRNACALIATAKAAAAVRRLRIDPLAWDCFLESWRQAAKSLLGPLARPASGAPKVSPPPVAISSNATEVVNYACRELASTNWPLAALSHWTLNWLKAGSDDAARRRIVPVGGCHADKGFVAYLTLTLLEDSRSELVEDPGIALRPFGEDLLETLRLQRRLRTSKSVSWSLSAQALSLSEPLDGSSLEAAAAVGFILLDSNRPYDSGSLLLAEVGDNDVLEAVGDEPLKIEAALLVRGIQRVGVAEDTHLSPADIDAFRSRGLVVERLGDVASAVDFASGLASGLRAYLRKILQAADENPEVYLEPRKPTELYIPLDVLKRVLKPRVPQPESDRKVERGRGELPPPEALDIGEEALWGQRPEETEERVPWEKELNKIRSGDGRMVVLTGPPGSGKTLLARMTAHQIAKQAVQHLEGQTKRVHEVELPIYVRLRDLAQKAGPGGYAKGETGLRRALRDVLSDSGDVVDEVVLNYLFGPEDQVTEPRVGPQGHAAEPRAWLFLDGLDEVERNETLQAWLGVLKNWQCRVVIASRPHGYAGWGPLPFSPTAYRLAPFTEQQAEDFIPKWYASDPSQEQSHESSRDQNRDASREQLIELFRSSQSVRQVAQSPLLLTLLCWVGERQELLPDVTRSQLYDLVMLDLLGLQKGGGVPNLARAKQLLPLMSELALDWFLKNKAKSLIPSEQLIDWIKDFPDRRRPAPINLENGQELNVELAAKLKGSSTEAEYLLGELVAKRLLCFADKNKNVFAFPHRSFVEYLAACALADGLKTEGPSRG